MPLTIPTRKGVVDSLRNSVRTELPQIDPSTERRSLIGGILKSVGSLMADFYLALKRYADREPFPQSATGAFLTKGWWVPITKLEPLPAAPAHGLVVVDGDEGTEIATGTQFGGAGVSYTSLQAATIITQSLIITSITPDPDRGVAVAETENAHDLASGLTVIISGATESDYNGVVSITVTADDTFEYEPATLPGSAATGSPLLTVTGALVEIEATTVGQDTNLSSGSDLSISDAPEGAGTTAYVCFGGITGGTDIETEDSYRARVMEALGTDYGMFSESEIKIVAKTVPGVTRVLVKPATYGGTNGVLEGQVKIAFLRDLDEDMFPSSQEIADVKEKVLSLLLPAHTAEEDVMVISLPQLDVAFTFTSITPDTPGMRRSIEANLKQFFREQIEWGAVVTEDEYRCAILAAYDTETRKKLRSFVLETPTGDITPTGDQYPKLDTVTWS